MKIEVEMSIFNTILLSLASIIFNVLSVLLVMLNVHIVSSCTHVNKKIVICNVILSKTITFLIFFCYFD